MRAASAVTGVVGGAAGVIGVVLRAAATLIGAVVIGFAIPAFWLWASGSLIAALGAGTVGFLVVVVAFVCIVASYVAIVWVVGLLAARRGGSEPPPRYAWNRSLRAERHEAPKLNRLEKLFIATALIAGAAYNIWFFTYAGPPLPLT